MGVAGRVSEQIALRLPVGMRDRLKLLAEASGRSMNSEIVMALKAHVNHTENEKSGNKAS